MTRKSDWHSGEVRRAHVTHPATLAFSSWLFNANGECLITRRALSKKARPGVWTNSVCGHPQADEATEQAIIRRCRFEVGAEITDITPIAPGSATVKPTRQGSLKTKSARSMPPA